MRYFRNKKWPIGKCLNYKLIIKAVREDNWHLRKEYKTYQDFMDKVVTAIIATSYEEIAEGRVTGWEPKLGAFHYN